MNKLPAGTRAQILAMMVEGVSIRSIARLTGTSKNTIVKLLREAGEACLDYQDATLRNLPCTRIQCDEIWSFVHAKEKNVPEARKGEFGVGDVWTWTALCADTKLVPCWHVGNRDAEAAGEFMHDLAARLRHRVHLTTDGHGAYLSAVAGAFGLDVDYAMLVKLYGSAAEGTSGSAERKYSPGECLGVRKTAVVGRPTKKDISTSYVERQNLTMITYCQLLDHFTGLKVYRLRSHVRKSVAAIGQAELDEIDVGVALRDDEVPVIFPIEAKAADEPVNRVQISTMMAFCREFFPGHEIRPLAIKLDYESVIHFLEFNPELEPARLVVVKSASYRLIMSEQQQALVAKTKVPLLTHADEE